MQVDPSSMTLKMTKSVPISVATGQTFVTKIRIIREEKMYIEDIPWITTRQLKHPLS